MKHQQDNADKHVKHQKGNRENKRWGFGSQCTMLLLYHYSII